MSSDQTFGIVLILVLSTVFTVYRALRGPIGQAIARRLSGAAEPPAHDEEITELRARVAELEERVDFTERVLLKQAERGQIESGRP